MLLIRPLQFKLNASGNGSTTFHLDQGEAIWEVQMISVQAQQPKTNAICQLYMDGFFACATSAGGGDTAQGPPHLYLSPGQILSCTYTSGFAGDTVILCMYYRELNRQAALGRVL